MTLSFYNFTRKFSTLLFTIIVFLSFSSLSLGQTISGEVINNLDNEPLIYVSIGVIGTSKGTISNEKGEFELNVNGICEDSLVRFSMIGFESKTFTIKELLNKKNHIQLDNKPIQLTEIIIKPSGKLEKVGTVNFTKLGGVCGWGGTNFGKGHEIGSKIELGKNMVQLKSMYIRLFKQSFDSTLLRLHIRDIAEVLPLDELLSQEIIISVSEEKGWVEIDLSKYNLIYKGDIALTLEWIKVYGINENRLMKMNGSKNYTANVLFNLNKNNGTFFIRKGSEAKWLRVENQSPSFYLTVQE